MKLTLRTRDDRFEVDCEKGERILYAGLRQGAPLPYECATGTCGTCRARARPGTIEWLWPEAPGAAHCRVERGEFLMCQCRALTDAEFLVPDRPPPLHARLPQPASRQGTVRRCRSLTHDVMAFDVEPDSDMTFAAGQFVAVEAPGVRGRRAYSMVSMPDRPASLEFVIKRKPDGGFSRWIFDAPRDGESVSLFGPLGAAVFLPEDKRDIVCLAGGSGIAGIMSILRRAGEVGHFEDHRALVVFGVRAERDVFYAEELAHLVRKAGPALSVVIAISDGTSLPQLDAALEVERGFVHDVAAPRLAQAAVNAIGYVAGPPPMVDASIRVLMHAGAMSPGDIRYDKFA